MYSVLTRHACQNTCNVASRALFLTVMFDLNDPSDLSNDPRTAMTSLAAAVNVSENPGVVIDTQHEDLVHGENNNKKVLG